MLAEMELMQWMWIGLIMFGASLIQGAIGFAYAIFGIPLLLLVGLPIEECIAVICVGSTLQSAQGFWTLRNEVERKTLIMPMGLRFIGVIFGVAVLAYFTTLPVAAMKMGAGWLILILLGIQVWSERLEGLQFNKLSSGALFLTSGVMAGMIGIGGPPLVIWSMAQQDWPTQRIRAFLYAQFCVVIPLQMGVMIFQFGTPLITTFVYTMMFFPLIYLGTCCGLYLGNKLSKPRLKMIAYGVLLLISGKMIMG